MSCICIPGQDGVLYHVSVYCDGVWCNVLYVYCHRVGFHILHLYTGTGWGLYVMCLYTVTGWDVVSCFIPGQDGVLCHVSVYCDGVGCRVLLYTGTGWGLYVMCLYTVLLVEPYLRPCPTPCMTAGISGHSSGPP